MGNVQTMDPDIQRLQAMVIMARRAQGASLTQLEHEMELSRYSIQQRTKLAKREGLLFNAADQVVNELVPLAMGVFTNALKDGDVAVARDVLYGAGILSKGNKAQIAPSDSGAQHGPPTLDEIRAMYLFREPEAPEDEALDGEVIKQLPAGFAPIEDILGEIDGNDEDSAHFASAPDEDSGDEGGRDDVQGDFTPGTGE